MAEISPESVGSAIWGARGARIPHMLTFAVGDIHGSYTKLVNLVRHCRAHGGDKPFRFVFLGDYVDRGRRSREVVSALIKMQSAAPERVVCLRGNHEELLLVASQGGNALIWLANGGHDTLDSYDVDHAAMIPAEHLAWFKQLPSTLSDGKRFFVHAGVEPGVPLQQQRDEILLWIREPFLSDTRDHGQFIVHGHTPLEIGEADLRPNRVNIDTGACFGGPLTAAVFDDRSVGPLAFITDQGTITRAPILGAAESA
jgi:diadenosine tetraphosphatase ApaH/serine/threonine PP2A family protein phosphatase